MKITVTKSHDISGSKHSIEANKASRSNFALGDISLITDCLRIHYDPRTFNCKDVSNYLEKSFENLKSVQVSMLVYEGQVICKNHYVNLMEDNEGKYLIDATGDQFGASNLTTLIKNITPWVYEKGADGIYYSQNHLPVFPPQDTYDANFKDFDLVRLTSSPLHRGFRCIFL